QAISGTRGSLQVISGSTVSPVSSTSHNTLTNVIPSGSDHHLTFLQHQLLTDQSGGILDASSQHHHDSRYYRKSETYNRSEVNALIGTGSGGPAGLHNTLVDLQGGDPVESEFYH